MGNHVQRWGGCHCGNITYTLDWPEDVPLALRKCSCGFCVKHAPSYIGHFRASLAVVVRDPSAIGKYEFGTRMASFHSCARCGVFLFATSVIDGREYAVLNAHTFDEPVPPTLDIRNFDRENLENRLARRSTTWISSFTI